VRAPAALLSERLAAASVRHPVVVLLLAAAGVGLSVAHGGRARSEVGYAAYFGPRSAEVARLGAFLDEFESGFHLLLVFECRDTPRCRRVDEPWALDFLARLHAAAERLPNVRRATSALNAPIVVGPLATRTLAERGADGRLRRAPDWARLWQAAREEPFFASTLVAPDARAAGVVVELQSIESGPLRESVRAALAMLPAFEHELGGELHLAGDPVWTVASADAIERDARRLTVLVFVAMAALLAARFRDPWLVALPLVAVAGVAAVVRGLAAAFGLPETSLLAALPPLLVAIAVAGALHLVVAVARAPAGAAGADAVVAAARRVGTGCLWSAVTTAAGFASFATSSLASFRHFGLLAAAGTAVAFALTFTVLPALLALRLRRGPLRTYLPQRTLAGEILAAVLGAVTQRPGFVLAASLGAFALLALGAARLRYASDFGFGEDSMVVRSLRAIEANFRKPMTTEVVVTLPPGRHVWESDTLRLLERIEAVLAAEPSTGAVWSFLDLLEQAQRIDRGQAPSDAAGLARGAERAMPLVAASERARWFWSEPAAGPERTRVSADRAWLDDAAQGPYVARVGARLEALARTPEASGHRIELAGGLVLADRFVRGLRETQRASFASATAVVAGTLALLLRPAALVAWALVANVLPVAALLGLMGWAGIGIDPANTMVGAILLALGVDDTIHLGLRVRAARAAGRAPRAAVEHALGDVGEAILVTSSCLALGFSVLLFSAWGGLVGFGLIASTGVALLLAGDLLLLPSALVLADGRAGRRRRAR
jgi:hypothetical protein